MTTLSYASYRQRATEGFESLAAALLARRTAGDTPGSDEIKSLTRAVLNDVGATKSQPQQQQQESGEHGEESWQIEAKQAALTRALELVVEQSVRVGYPKLVARNPLLIEYFPRSRTTRKHAPVTSPTCSISSSPQPKTVSFDPSLRRSDENSQEVSSTEGRLTSDPALRG